MTNLLSAVGKPQDRPAIITVCGDAGMGKTSLAAAFPKPIFIRAEDGMQSIPKGSRPDAFPVATSADDVFNQLIALGTEEHDYQTVVIDSITKLDAMFVTDVLKRDGKAKSINQALGGYGAGQSAVNAMHGRVRNFAGRLNNAKNMNVVFIAHANVETMRLPDTDDYMRYSLPLHEKARAHYVDDVDLVGFIRLMTYLKGDEGDRKKAISTGEREIVCHATAASISKNRFGLTEAISVKQGENPFAGILPNIPALAEKESA